jgi:hypothetical protein
MITPTVKTGQPLLIATKVGINKFIFEYQVASTKYQVGKETRAKSREARTESQETRAKRRETRCPGAVRFLCVSAPLRAIERLRHEVRFLPQAGTSYQSLQLILKKKKRNRLKFEAYQYGLFYIFRGWKISLFRQENIDLQILRVSWGNSTSRFLRFLSKQRFLQRIRTRCGFQ